MPPYHTCAIRKAVAQQTVFLPVFSQTLTAWAAKQPGTSLKEMPSQTPNIDGLPSTVYIWELHRGPDTQAEKLIAIVTNFSDGAAELRLARAIGNR
jgi:hypothetical protein